MRPVHNKRQKGAIDWMRFRGERVAWTTLVCEAPTAILDTPLARTRLAEPVTIIRMLNRPFKGYEVPK